MTISGLGCVYCVPTNPHWRPDKIYILDGCSVCEYCLHKIRTSYEETGEGYRPLGQNVELDEILEPYSQEAVTDIVAKSLVNITMKLFNEDGVCLMSSRVGAPVINGDTVQFPPIKVSL